MTCKIHAVCIRTCTISMAFLATAVTLFSQGFEGYYSHPSLHDGTIAFCAEGDIWTVPLEGGLAYRLTTHPEEEINPKFSPDGATIMFSASYEGPTEIYTIPVQGGITTRWTYERDASIATAWTPDGHMVYATRGVNKKPDFRLVRIDPETYVKTVISLDQASESSFNADGTTLYFVRPAYHRNVTKRYQGGTARQIWKFSEGAVEAVKLTTDHPGESHHPMWFDGRVYHVTDRDGIMNIWSMNEDGGDLMQHTNHKDFDVRQPSISNGIIVYKLGADLWRLDLSSGSTSMIDIRLMSDLDQLREKWEEEPVDHITSIHPDEDGKKVVITARGRVFVIPVQSGRTVSFAHKTGVRYRNAVFSADNEKIIALSDKSGEFEFVQMPANGIGEENSLTDDAEILRYGGMPSPDGKWIAYSDLARNMYVLNVSSGESTLISTNQEGVGDFSWAPDSKWLAFVQVAFNDMAQIHVYNVDSGEQFELTTDRANSTSPNWSPDGKFIYFISDRNFETIVGSPWGTRQPEPYLDASEKIYHISLQAGTRSPFRPDDELESTDDSSDAEKSDSDDDDESDEDEGNETVTVTIDVDGIQARLAEVPVKPGNYRNLKMSRKALYFLTRETGVGAKTHLAVVKIDNEEPEIKTIAEGISGYDLTRDGKKLLITKQKNYYMVDAGTSEIKTLDEGKIDLSDLKFPIDPREDWKQIFTDAWRMERDYFYDPNMHGVDWDAMHDKYLPLVDRVTTRNELSDVIGRFVGELSALHTSVRGGDTRSDEKSIAVANLGADLTRSNDLGGYLIEYIYKADPDYPDERSPLDDPYLDIREGDIITAINGIDALDTRDIGELLRGQEGKQVRLALKRGDDSRDVIVKPIGSTYNLRYRDWEYGNRLYVEEQSADKIGYLHLRAMSSNDIEQFYREFYPVFDRQGLIIDVRYNFGGNIDAFILERLLRKAWMYWKARDGKPYWNMHYAFRGHIVILVNENTYSDGEAFADGFSRLGLGTSIGTRTWGGEIWLHSGNRLSDGGIARAPMFGVYADGEWLIEGHGYEPDIEVDNLPHATFNGEDAQLDRAIQHLEELISEDPREVPDPPAYPDKSFGGK